jgi:mannose-6-phosphate isomerase-like protein (cupin superfamily)
MFHAGDQIENPVTGERIVFYETAAETDGRCVMFETIVKPGGFVAAAHIHPFQAEHFEVLAGTLGMRRGKETVELRPGDSITVERGTPHKFWNAGDGEVRFVCTVRPALQFERLIATMYGLAAAGKTNRKGMPNPVRLAVIANNHFDDVRLPKVPQWLQKASLAVGAPFGRLVGYKATFDWVPADAAEAAPAEAAPAVA